MKNRWRTLILFSMLNLVMFGFNNCAPLHNGDGDFSSSSVGGLDTTSAAAQQMVQILSARCASCHGNVSTGGVTDITDLNHLVAAGLVIPGNPAGSPLVQAVENNSMPTTGPLSQSDKDAISAWVQNALPAPPPTNVNPTPPTSTNPVISSETYSSISANLLTPKCVACHGPTTAGAGYRFDSYAETVKAVQPGNVAGSLLYNQVASGSMPQGGPVLGSADLQNLAQWILNGAQNN